MFLKTARFVSLVFAVSAAGATLALLSGGPRESRAQTVASPVTTWNAIRYNNGLLPGDPTTDQQTGTAEGDIVGDAAHPFLFTLYDPGSAASATDGTLYFKIRVNADSSPAGFKSAALIGFSFTSNVSSQPIINVFAGVNNSGSADGIYIYGADSTKTNISPSTSGVGAVLFNYAETSSNYDFSPVSAVNEPGAGSPYNFDSGTTGADYFVGFAIPFANLVSAVKTATTVGTTPGIDIDDKSGFRIIAFNATQGNTLNQDIGGINDKTANTALPFSDLNAISQTYSASTLLPTPAPPGILSGLVGIAMGGAQFGITRLRRRRKHNRR